MNDKVNLKKKHATKFIQTFIQNLQLYTNWLLFPYYYLNNIKRPTIIIVYSILVTDISQNKRYKKLKKIPSLLLGL